MKLFLILGIEGNLCMRKLTPENVYCQDRRALSHVTCLAYKQFKKSLKDRSFRDVYPLPSSVRPILQLHKNEKLRAERPPIRGLHVVCD